MVTNVTNESATKIDDQPLHGKWLVVKHKVKYPINAKEAQLTEAKLIQDFITRKKVVGFNANDHNQVVPSIF